MTKKFVRYIPDRPVDAKPVVGLKIVEATCDDLAAVADLIAQRERNDPERHLEYLNEQLVEGSNSCQIFIARLEAELVAYARISRHQYPDLPVGWYLTGLVIAADQQRRGIGRAVTEHRIHWLRSRSDFDQLDHLYYFASSRNDASRDLHARLGFTEIKRNISVPGCTFEDGIGILYSLPLNGCH
ncbi:MAG TPA: GNAT family N-acetyltransferase [Planctomycetes bacterium]|nr:GNAT family N-acetyltransferase [Planctomycetota bacterium]